MLQTAVPVLSSLNADETIAFYTKKLGFILDANWDGYLIFHRDNIIIHLWPCNDPEIPKATGCYVHVTEVDDLYSEYKAQGIIHPNDPLKNRPWNKREFSVLDNNGNLIRLGEDIA